MAMEPSVKGKLTKKSQSYEAVVDYLIEQTRQGI